jgi:hypothetical protein
MRLTTDTADRLRPTDTLHTDGARWLVLEISSVPTATRPARLAVSVCEPYGSLSDLADAHTVFVDAGDTVTYQPGSTHLADVVGRRPGM